MRRDSHCRAHYGGLYMRGFTVSLSDEILFPRTGFTSVCFLNILYLHLICFFIDYLIIACFNKNNSLQKNVMITSWQYFRSSIIVTRTLTNQKCGYSSKLKQYYYTSFQKICKLFDFVWLGILTFWSLVIDNIIINVLVHVNYYTNNILI